MDSNYDIDDTEWRLVNEYSISLCIFAILMHDEFRPSPFVFRVFSID